MWIKHINIYDVFTARLISFWGNDLAPWEVELNSLYLDISNDDDLHPNGPYDGSGECPTFYKPFAVSSIIQRLISLKFS